MIKIEFEEELNVNSVDMLKVFEMYAEGYFNKELSLLTNRGVRNVQVIDMVPIFNGNRELLTFLLESYKLQGYLEVSDNNDVLYSRVFIKDAFLIKSEIVEEYLETLTLNALRKGTNKLYRDILLLNRHNNGLPFNLMDLFDLNSNFEVINDCFLLAKHGYISFIFNGYLDLPAVMLTDKEL